MDNYCRQLKISYRRLIKGESPSFVWWVSPLFLVAAILLPFLLTRSGCEFLNYKETGGIGDTIGGIVGPFIAAIAALLTFFAFWVQQKANKIQQSQILKQDLESKVDRFDTRFYEMLKLHRDNVAEINIANKVYGRRAFKLMFKEFQFIYYGLKAIYLRDLKSGVISKKLDEFDFVNIAYLIFFFGVGVTSDKLTEELTKKYEKKLIENFITYLKDLNGKLYSLVTHDIQLFYEKDSIKIGVYLPYKPFDGHMSRLGHYYRHLFQTVKFVSEQGDKISDKYNYIKTIRAQLSIYEQLMIYYNSLSTLGKPWLDNNYFKEYKFIKNLPLPLADFGVRPKELLGEKNDRGEFLFEWDEILSS